MTVLDERTEAGETGLDLHSLHSSAPTRRTAPYRGEESLELGVGVTRSIAGDSTDGAMV